MKQRIISITSSNKHKRAVNLGDEQYFPRKVGQLANISGELLTSGSGWLEYSGKNTILRFVHNKKVNSAEIASISPTAMSYLGDNNGVGKYVIGTARGIYIVDTSDAKPKATALPVEGNEPYPHITDLKKNNIHVVWHSDTGNFGQIS